MVRLQQSNLSAVATFKIKVLDEKSPSTSNGVDRPNSELEALSDCKGTENF